MIMIITDIFVIVIDTLFDTPIYTIGYLDFYVMMIIHQAFIFIWFNDYQCKDEEERGKWEFPEVVNQIINVGKVK